MIYNYVINKTSLNVVNKNRLKQREDYLISNKEKKKQ